jgi:hypothetical protein
LKGNYYFYRFVYTDQGYPEGRSFGGRTALDNIIVILLGALLSRAIVGASGFFPLIASSFVIVIIHGFLCVAYRAS